ncbi:SH3 domain-containing protein [Oceanicola sp. 22II-s10i]|uniref:SH3 domain-containing protein n=1 Tax=Oceanicola sp. 22II-s10i TaxID=1317116 RepID=UPI001595C882|nr:SH3 domain-containing protein [Oceanicola sp. 22II-s10i]
MPIRSTIAALATVLALGAAPAVQAQSVQEFVKAFSGQWYVFDPAYASAKDPCAISLEDTGEGEPVRYKAASSNCVTPVSGLKKWYIDEGMLHLLDASDSVIIRLGGNQSRITGEIEGTQRAVIVERAAGSQETAALAEAIRKHRCIYVGFTSDCAKKEDLAEPAMTEDGGVYASVGIVARMNVRSQPRSDATVIGVLNEGICLKVNFCTTASDGIWCRARFGEDAGWVRKTALRQSEWPVMTFANSCSDAAGG